MPPPMLENRMVAVVRLNVDCDWAHVGAALTSNINAVKICRSLICINTNGYNHF